MKFHTLRDINFSNKRVLVRTDFNVPLNDNGGIINDKRVKASLPTIKYLLKKDSKIILMSHLGRPEGKVVSKLKMDKVAKRLSKLLRRKVMKLDDCVGKEIKSRVSKMKSREIVLLENLRFYKEEEENNKKFSKSLSELADIYVNDAFGSSHRAHSSIVGVPKYLPGCAGLLLQKEIEMLNVKTYKKPFIAIMGGGKVRDKIRMVGNLLKKADKVLLAGAMIFTFYKVYGLEAGKRRVEKKDVRIARRLIKEYGRRVVLPLDLVAAKSINQKAKTRNVKFGKLTKNDFGVDIGKETIKQFSSILKDAKTVFWNGPLGIYEIKKFAKGTEKIARILAKSKARVIIGGGDTAAVVEKLKLDRKFAHVSTGGGASLEFIEKSTLPGIKALQH